MAFQHQRKLIAGGLFVAAIVCVIIAATRAYSTWNRWRVNGHLDRSAAAVLAGHPDKALRAAASAADIMPGRADAVLPATDPDLESSLPPLERLAQQAKPRERQRVLAALQFVRAIHGKEVDASGLAGSDGNLVVYLGELQNAQRGDLPTPPEISPALPPARAILHRTLEERVHTAWRLADADGLMDAATALRYYDPSHPAATTLGFLTFVLAGPDPSHLPSRLQQTVGAEHRARILRGLLHILDREDRGGDALQLALLKSIPEQQRSSTETTRILRSGGEGIETLVANARRSDSAALRITAINRCVAAGRYDLLPGLAERGLDQAQRDAVLLAVAIHQGDFAAIERLAENPADHLPQVRNPSLGADALRFHFVTASGSYPTQAPRVTIDGIAITEGIARVGSVVSVPIAGQPDRVDLAVRAGDRLIYEGTVRR